MWFRGNGAGQSIGAVGSYFDNPVNFSTTVVVRSDQVLAFDNSSPVFYKSFTTTHLWADHAPNGTDMNTSGLVASSRVLDVKNNGRTVLMGAFVASEYPGNYPKFIFEISIIGSGSMVYDPTYGTFAPSGFSTSFVLLYTSDDCGVWNSMTPSQSYDNTVQTGLTLDCAAQAPGSSGTINNSITYDKLDVEQRVIGAYYDQAGNVAPVLLIRRTLLTGSGTDYVNWVKDSAAPYDCHRTNHGYTWDITITTSHEVKFKSDVISGSEYIRKTTGFSDYDQYDAVINLVSDGAFVLPNLGINMAYSGHQSEGFSGTLPVFDAISHVSVPGHSGYYLYQGVTQTSSHVYGLVEARSGSAVYDPSKTVTQPIVSGRYYGFVSKTGAIAGAVFAQINGSLGAFTSRLFGTTYPYNDLDLTLNHKYTAYNPHTGEVAVLHQYPVWFV